jgi:arylsulfatase A-like enzyme
VILITVDTWRADVGFLGYPKPITPNLDKLAAKGAVFERAYSMASYTGKCIGPMLIGRYPGETLRDGTHFNKYEPKNLFVTERVKEAGYHTFGAAGHWYFRPWSGVTQGMDLFDVTSVPPTMTDNDTTVTSEQITNVALKLFQDPEHTAKPFFMWVHYFDPHAQYVPHPEGPDFLGEARGGAAQTRAAYDSEVWFVDKHVGRLLDAVAASNVADKTAIIVTADHGEAFGEHNMSWHGMEIWEPLVHVPLLVYVPGKAPKRVAQKRSHIDIAPTILELTQTPLQTGDAAVTEGTELRGRSLISDITGTDAPEERDVYLDMPAGPFNLQRRALITGSSPGLKLLHFGGNQYSLFDLKADPDEKTDLAQDKERLKTAVDAMARLRAGLVEIEVKPSEAQ